MQRLFHLFVVCGSLAVLLASGSGVLSGCDGDGDGDADADAEADCTGDDPSDGATEVFIIDSLRIGDANVGFNLDGVDTPAGCTNDFCRRGPEDGRGGVDNRLGPILADISETIGDDFDANRSIEDSLLEGSMLLLIRMRDVDDWSDDSCVSVDFFVGHDPEDPPTIAAGRTYQVDSRSLAGSQTDIDDPVISFDRNGLIEGGVFRGGPAAFAFTFPINEETDLSIEISEARLRWDASASSITGGVLGGYVTLHDLLGALRNVEQAQSYLSVVSTVMQNQADIDAIAAGEEIPGTRCTPENVATYDVDGNGCGSRIYTCSASGRCVEPEEHYDAISLGIQFTAVPAVLDGLWTPPTE